ncbi:hypothetical protein D3C76_630750 [compost metagenome]
MDSHPHAFTSAFWNTSSAPPDFQARFENALETKFITGTPSYEPYKGKNLRSSPIAPFVFSPVTFIGLPLTPSAFIYFPDCLCSIYTLTSLYLGEII